MCSSSTASTTAPLAWARSVSRIRAACISAAVAAWSDPSSWPEIWRRTATNNPAPRSASIRVNTPAYQSVRSSRSRASCLMRATSRAEPVARARQRLGPRHELPEGERFRQVVIGAGLEPAHPVVQGIERRQHQDRRGDAAAAQLAAQVEARAVGQADVQDDRIVAAERGLLQAVCESGRECRIDALRAQAVAQQARQLGIVFYDQYPHPRLRSSYNGRSRTRPDARQRVRYLTPAAGSPSGSRRTPSPAARARPAPSPAPPTPSPRTGPRTRPRRGVGSAGTAARETARSAGGREGGTGTAP